PWVVDDYFAAEEITHVYDHAVTPEHLRSIAAAPVVVDGAPRAVLYVASRSSVDFGDRLLESVARVVQLVERDLAVEEEVRRRLAAAPPALHSAEVHELVAELSQIAATVQDEGIRRRLVDVCRRTRLLAGRVPSADRSPAQPWQRSGCLRGNGRCWQRSPGGARTTRSPRRWGCCRTR